MDIFTTEKRSEIMRKIGPKDSKAEIILRRKLYEKGFRYRLHVKNIPGKPDLVLRRFKTIIFIDGDWWHGRNYKKEYKKYSPFWQKKIQKNMERDRNVNKQLNDLGWTVIRVWEKDINRKRTQEKEIEKILKLLKT